MKYEQGWIVCWSLQEVGVADLSSVGYWRQGGTLSCTSFFINKTLINGLFWSCNQHYWQFVAPVNYNYRDYLLLSRTSHFDKESRAASRTIYFGKNSVLSRIPFFSNTNYLHNKMIWLKTKVLSVALRK